MNERLNMRHCGCCLYHLLRYVCQGVYCHFKTELVITVAKKIIISRSFRKDLSAMMFLLG